MLNYRFKSLKQRMVVFMLIPTATLLITGGFIGFFYTRNHLLNQWGEATLLKLQRAGHHVDMRLNQPRQMLNLLNEASKIPNAKPTQNLLLSQMESIEGVLKVNLKWFGAAAEYPFSKHVFEPTQYSHGMTEAVNQTMMMMHQPLKGQIKITQPTYNDSMKKNTISFLSVLKDINEASVGVIEIVISFDDVIRTVASTGWWKQYNAYIIDDTGNILVSNLTKKRELSGENDTPIEKATLAVMEKKAFGTVIGKGFPPDKIAGFYKLKMAPWTLVIISKGEEILSPIIRFQLFYLLIGATFFTLILFLIRFVSGHTIKSLKTISSAAGHVAKGDYSVSLPILTKDEVGELIHSFNTMVGQLKERERLKKTIHIAKEVQQNLLPGKTITYNDGEITGKSLYCDETGGDYFDFIFPGSDPSDHSKLAVLVGDVSGHGIGPALLMTTARALIRSRMRMKGTLSEFAGDVNQLLCSDTEESGNFMTLFFLMIEPDENKIQWIRAGHNPAVLYNVKTDTFTELTGKGMALGVDKTVTFKTYEREGLNYGEVIVIGTDGIWEAENKNGEAFGKNRLNDIIRRNSYRSADQILTAILLGIRIFKGNAIQKDDMTLVVIKAASSVQINSKNISQTIKREKGE